jgi:DNA-binding LytR/AlgR family response regulator
MNPVTLLLAEDEAPQRQALAELLAELWPEARVVAACVDGLEALEAFEREGPDVVFLDIRMPGLSGLEVASAVRGRAHLVFVTAYDEHALRAFEEGAVDYVLKPVRRERLAETVQRLRQRVTGSPVDAGALLARLRDELARAPRRDGLKWITASVGDTVKLYPLDEVLAFQAQDKYTRVITAKDEAVIRKSLRELLSVLDPEIFWQVHRSVIVRAAAIDRVRRDELGKHWLTLKEHPEPLPVSSAFQSRFRGM